jgi:tRNA-Thr(GGU) m(6)t(6)A37 methyltransferase TsaA
MEDVTYRPIGVIHSPYTEQAGTPIQAKVDPGTHARIEIFPEFVEGLDGLEGFSHIILIYHFHRSRKANLRQTPFLDDRERGVFAIRSPSRPNPIGFSVVNIVAIEGNIIEVSGVDILDGTPLLDIKPYVPDFDIYDAAKTGWLERRLGDLERKRDDGRFAK